MEIADFNPIIFTISLGIGFVFWKIAKMSAEKNSTFENRSKLSKWWTVRQINKWKEQNSCSDDYNNENEIAERLKIYGLGVDGSAIYIDFNSHSDRNEAYFVLKLKDGLTLTAPDHPVAIVSKKSNELKAGALTIHQIVPYTKWRIVYNGLAKVHKTITLAANQLTQSCDEAELQHVNLTFFWNAASDPVNYPNDWNSNLLAKYLNGKDHQNGIEQPLNDLLISNIGFDQFGALFGQVTVEYEDSKLVSELNFPGVRQIRHVVHESNSLDEHLTMIGACKDGFVFQLSAKDVDCQLKVYSGCVRLPNANVCPIEFTNLQQSDFEKKDTSFTLKADGKNFKISIQIDTNSTTKVYGVEDTKTQTEFTLDVNGQRGFGSIILHTKSFKSEENKGVRDMFKHILKTKPITKAPSAKQCDQSVLTAFFNEPEARSEQLCGGKGSSLGYLTKLSEENKQFIVPQGFTLTTRAFEHQVKRNDQLESAMLELKNVAYKRVDGSLDEACDKVCKLFRKIPIEREIIDAIQQSYEALEKISNQTPKLAIRSSAIGEDGSDSSSAGQNETFLGVVGFDQVKEAIQKCWASLFTTQSVSYRVQNIQPIQTQMAVVVQTMVASDCAGVLFTHHPVNNDPNKVLITANYGLGESVVSGLVDPDMFVIRRSYRNNNLKVLERKLGDKKYSISLTSDGKINDSNIDDSLRKKLCLDDEKLLLLCSIGIFVEHQYDSPRDIEWAISGNQIYLLQSRPMTSTNAFSTWELIHEFDTAIMSDEDLHTFGNVGEVMPEPLTPLCVSTWPSSFEKALLANFPKGVIETSLFYSQVYGITHNRFAMNIMALIFRTAKKEIALENRLHGLAVFGHEFISEEAQRIGLHRFGVSSISTRLLYLSNAFKFARTVKMSVKEMNELVNKFTGIYNKDRLDEFASTLDLYNDVSQKLDSNFVFVLTVHCKVTMMTTFYQILTFFVLAEGRNEMTADFLSDATSLLSSCQNAESAEIPTALEEITRSIQKCDSAKIQEFCDIDATLGVEWLRRNCDYAYERFMKFIEKNSHRGYQEFDFGYETWGLNPSLVIEMLQNSIRNLPAHSGDVKKKPKRSNAEIIAELKTPTRSSTRKVINFFLPKCQACVESRERTKSLLIAYIHELRKAYRYLAKKMQQDGLLPDTELIFYLTHAEIGCLLKERNRVDLISKAMRRRRVYPEMKKLKFEEFQWGVMKPMDDTTKLNTSNADSAKVIGTPVCEGTITGRACVVKSFSEVSKIKPGDILITHSTDIAWSPYFPILSGVVTELGGLISHGAVVAREYGLPCIVGATNATALIPDGAEIFMNASAGVISTIDSIL